MKLLLSMAMGLCLAVSLAFAAPVVAAPGNDGNNAPQKERMHRPGKHKPEKRDKADMRRHERHKDGQFDRDDRGRRHDGKDDDRHDRSKHKDKKHKKHKGDKPGKHGDRGKHLGHDKGPKGPMSDAGSDRDVWLQRARSSELLSGKASWYGSDFQGGPTASGVNYDMFTFTAAHRTLPMGTIVKVTDEHNGKNVLVCVTDRGPFVRGRVIDLSVAAARQLDMYNRGVANVNLEVVSDEKGVPLKDNQAWFIRYKAASGQEKVGPFRAFADAAAMHEALRQAHPEAEVIVE